MLHNLSNRTFAAVAQLGDKPSINIFDVKQNKRKKTLFYGDMTATEYVSLSFSADGHHLASLTGSPDYALLYWKWDKGRMVCQAKTTGGTGPVYEVYFLLLFPHVVTQAWRIPWGFIKSRFYPDQR